MRFLILALFFILAACSKSSGPRYSAADIAADRTEPWSQVQRVDRTEWSTKPLTQVVELPVARVEGAAPAKPAQAETIQLLLNQMKIENPKVSVGKRAGLVRFTAIALIDEKPVEVNLEGHLKDDSTADLLNVDDRNEEIRAEVFCRGEVESAKGSYSCNSLFVDLYYKLDDKRYYREQLELESEQEKAIKAQEKAASLNKPVQEDQELVGPIDPEKDEGEHGDIPEPLGTYQGRPERVKDLFSLKKEGTEATPIPKPSPTPVSNKKQTTQPQKPSADSMNNGASISGRRRKPAPTPAPTATPAPQNKPKPTPTPVKPIPAPKPKATPVAKPTATPAPQATAKPKATPVATPAPKPTAVPAPPKPKATATPKPTPKMTPTPTPKPVVVPVVPARVIIDVEDDANRPVDQAVGGYSGGGKLENSTAMPTSSQHHYFSKPHENQFYGTYDLVRVVKLLAKEIYTKIFPGIKIRINDFSKRKGGYIPPHQGHQNGLEADIGYLTENSHKKIPQHAKINGRWVLNFEAMWKVFKFLGGSSRVSLFYVNKSVKPQFCHYARSELRSTDRKTSDLAKLTLRKMEAIGGHTSHFHVRMECGRHNPRCKTDGPTKPNTGC